VWRAHLPTNKDVHLSPPYKPSVGGTSSVSFFYDGKFSEGSQYTSYKTRFCMDDGFENAVRQATNADGYQHFYDSRLQYILTTGGNWANGSIGKFKLTVDKGNPKALISLCL